MMILNQGKFNSISHLASPVLVFVLLLASGTSRAENDPLFSSLSNLNAPQKSASDSSEKSESQPSLSKLLIENSPKLTIASPNLNLLNLDSLIDSKGDRSAGKSNSDNDKSSKVSSFPESLKIDSIQPFKKDYELQDSLFNSEEAIDDNFALYLRPICESVDRLGQKQFATVQNQLKQFVELTNGRLASCFLESYKIDPSKQYVSKSDLHMICESRYKKEGSKGSFTQFSNCSVSNWDPSLDKELDRINAARLNCNQNHQHPGDDDILSMLSHDEEEIISDFVSKVLEGDKTGMASQVKVIDVLTHPTSSPDSQMNSNVNVKPIVTTMNLTKDLAKDATKEMLKDPNTVVVLVDDSKNQKITTTTTRMPVIFELPGAKDDKISPKPDISSDLKSFDISTINLADQTAKILNSANIVTTPNGSSQTNTTLLDVIMPGAKKLEKHETSSRNETIIDIVTSDGELIRLPSTKAPSLGKQGDELLIIVSQPSTSTPHAPSSSSLPLSTSGSGATIPPATVIQAIQLPSTVAPSEKTKSSSSDLEEIIKRHQKDKDEIERKFQSEKEELLKQLRKKQDEIDTHNAIKALQAQRDQVSINHKADTRLHQLEHDRQMVLDPFGHMMKHQQYEMNKQRRL